jgi:esterase
VNCLAGNSINLMSSLRRMNIPMGDYAIPASNDNVFPAQFRTRSAVCHRVGRYRGPVIVDVGGTRIAGQVTGAEDAPPMVLLHGLGDGASDWAPVLRGLSARHRVYALDLRGHGRSGRPGKYSFELMRDDVAGFLGAAGIGPCVIVGHSMGGVVGLLLAQTRPELLTHLVVEDVTAPRPGALSRPPLTPPEEPTPFDFLAVNAIRAELNDPDPGWWDGQARITTPTLFIGGSNSPIPHELLVDAVAMMPAARLVTLDAGHHVHRDRPAEFVAAVEAFLPA